MKIYLLLQDSKMEMLVEKLNNYSKFGIPQVKRNHDEDIEECKLIFIYLQSHS